MSKKKILCIGQGTEGKIFVEACLYHRDDGFQRLGLSGVFGPMFNGDAKGAFGQIQDDFFHEGIIQEYFDPWDEDSVKTLVSVWDEYHLNDMKAGSPRQERYLDENNYRSLDYESRVEVLEIADLEPDTRFEYNYGKGLRPYRYGSAWLKAPLPSHILEWFNGLPETTLTYPWR